MDYIHHYCLQTALCIDLVVPPVRADESDIDDAVRIIDLHHDAILVADDSTPNPALQKPVRHQLLLPKRVLRKPIFSQKGPRQTNEGRSPKASRSPRVRRGGLRIGRICMVALIKI
jgi:hypothetical protein